MDGNFSPAIPQPTPPGNPSEAQGQDTPPVPSAPQDDPADRDAYWANVISNIDAQKMTTATGNIVAAQGSNPDSAAMAKRLAPVLGIPAASIESDPNFWQGQFDTRAARAAMSTDDSLKTWLATDPMNAKLALGDIPHLNAIGRLFNGIGQGWNEGMLGGRAGWLQAKEQYFGLSPQQTDVLQTYREQMAAMQQRDEPGFAAGAGRVIGGFPASVVADAPTVALGTGAGAVVGGLTAGPLGILPGAFTGGNAAFAASQGVQASGEIYDQLSNTTDQYGRPIPEATRQAVSALAGLGLGALNMVGGNTISATAKAAAGATLKDMAIQAAMRPGLAAGLTRTAAALVKSSATGAVLNAGMGAIQSLAPQLAEAMTSPDFATVFNDPAQRQQWIADRLREAELGGATFPLLEMPGHLAAWWADAARANKAGADAATGAQLADAVAQSKTVQRAPDAAAGLLNKYAQAEGIDNLYIPGDRLQELYQGMQTRPGAPEDPFGFVPDMQEQLSRAQLTGGDVEIPTGDFLAHLAGSDIERNLRPDIRWGADAMTARESADFHSSNFPDLINEEKPATGGETQGGTEAEPDAEGAEVAQAPNPAAETEQVKYDLKQQLMRAGMTPDQAEQNAAVSTAIFRTLAQRGGVSPMELYRQFGPVVQRNLRRFGPGNYGAMDEVIDSLRRGDKMPSDKQLYGDSLLEYLSKGENARGKNMTPLSAGGKRAQTGGLVDEGGELSAMDADKWHRGQPGRRKLVNPEGMRLEEAAQRTHAAGYFPDHTEAPDTNELLDAIRSELNGSPVYKRPTPEVTKREEFRTARSQLEQFLHEQGIDIKTASNAEIKAALNEGAKEFNQTAYHGGPHVFDHFETSKIGSGEGAQVYGHGLYFAGNKEVAAWYRRKLSKEDRVLLERGSESRDLLHSDEIGERLAANTLQEASGDVARAKAALARVADLHPGNPAITQAQRILDEHGDTLKFQPKGDGRLYHVEIPEEHEYLDWDKELNQQPQAIQEAVEKVWRQIPEDLREEYEDRLNTPFSSMTGREIYRMLERAHTDDALPARPEEYERGMRSDEFASATLKDNGVAGVEYLDGRSRGAGEGSRNYVVFDDTKAHILHYEQSAGPAVSLQGNELGAYSTHKEMQILVKEKLKEIRAAGPVHNPELGQIDFDRESIGKTLYGLSEEKARLVPALRDILANGHLVTSIENHKGDRNIKAFHTLETAVRVEGKDVNARVVIRERYDGKFYYDLKSEPSSELFQARENDDSSSRAKEQERDSLDRGLAAAPVAKENVAPAGDDFNLSLSQPEGNTGSARGSIRLGAGKPVIALFKEADPSTFMHEMGHLLLNMVSEMADQEGASAEITEMASGLRKWLGVKEGEQPTVEQHEQFARGFETYLMTGKAPSIPLQSAFRKFAAWLTRIYRDIKALGVPISDQVRSIMDRMVATDEEIAEARQVFGMNPLFRTPEEAGMTIDMFNRYTARVNQEQDALYAKALKRNMRAEALKRRKEYKAEADAVRPEIERQVKSRPVLQAWYLFRYGKDLLAPENEVMAGKLSSEAARELLGPAYPQLPRDITAPNGFHPDIMAEAYGYDSGEAMLRDLVNENTGRLEAAIATGKPISLNGWIKRLVDQSLDDHLQNEFGSKLADDGVEQAAIDATESEGRMDIMATELRALANKAGIDHPQLSVQIIKQLAKDKLAEMSVAKATNAARYRRDEAKAARDAERALLAGKHIDAWKAKQRQMVAHAFAEEAQRLSDTFDRTTKRWRVTAKSPTRAGTAQPFMDQVHGILNRLGMNVKRDPGELGRALEGKSLESFLTSQAHQGYPIQVPSFMLDAHFAKHYTDLTSTEFEAARDAITSLLHVGRTQGEIQLQGRRADLQEEVDAASDMMERLPDVAVTERLNPGKAKDLEAAIYNAGGAFRTGDAALVKMEQLFQDYGGRDAKDARSNPFLRILDRLKEGQHANDDRQVEMAAGYRALKDQLPKGWTKSLRTRVETPELLDFRTGRPMRMTRDELIGIMLNMGNESNLKKLYEGYKWSPEAVEAVVSRLARPEDVTFVNAIHGFMRDLFPEIDAMQRRVTGIGMGRFEDTPRDLPAGRLTGGYYPIDYDPVRAPTERARMNAEGVFDENYRFATTPKGHTIARTDYVAPIRLGTSYISRAIGQQIHDLSFREPIQDAVKFFNHPAIIRLMKEKSGPEYQRLVTDWLRYAANATNVDDKALGVIDNFFRYVRIGGSVVGIGFRASTLLKHGSSALVNSIGEVGGRELLAAARDLYRPGGDKLRAWIMENSGELRHRQEHLDRDARTQFAAMMGEKTWISTIQHYGFWPVAMADMGSAMPTWLAAQRAAIGKGMSAAESFAEADRAVRNAHGSGAALDLAAIQRPTGRFSELMKCWTMFYGFFDHMYNRGVRQVARSSVSGVRNLQAGDYVGARRDFVDALGRTFWYIAMPAMIEAAVAGTLKQAWDDEDTNWFEWGAKAILGQVAASIPIVRDVASHELEGYDFDPSPLSEMVKNVDASTKDIARATGMSDKPVSNRWLEHAANTTGYIFHLPLGQAGTTAQYLWDFSDGTADPQSVGEFLAGVMRGPPKGQ